MRIEYVKVVPDVYRAMMCLEHQVEKSGLESPLLDLIKLRASQINGCAYCIDMHSKDARARGETEQRLYELDAWRESPFYTEREQAALAWTEALTLVTNGHVPNGVYEEARKQFTDVARSWTNYCGERSFTGGKNPLLCPRVFKREFKK
ncbi:carboxymuconolactone decarboxylase family protein [Geobacter grbiciae]|uniref:carboxymuconolactone decarboxylase family protein n=1 Tax=Geobacter grbiciae TaxID=155042 RepID=UPI001FE58ED4|nr:carboxymuconolactone decarboxylase family protein [Geobacter grbiciae]